MSDTGNVLPLADGAGRADRIAAVRRQEIILKTGALQTAILTSANFSIIATDEKGIIQIFNVGAERMLGYVAAEVVNRISLSELHDPQEAKARAQALSLELATPIAPGFEALAFKASRGIEDVYELTFIRKNGSRFLAMLSVTALRDEDGQIIGYLLIGTDISQRKAVEEDLRKSEWRLRYATESARLTYVEADLARGGARTPENFAAVMGYAPPPEQEADISAGTRLLLEHVVPHDRPRVTAAHEEFLAGTPAGTVDYRVLGDDQVERWIETRWSVEFASDGKPLKSFATNLDITERKQIEQSLNNAIAVAQRANLAKSEFLSSMSHELRTPLSAILGFAQLMESGSPPPTTSQKRSIDQILQAGWYLLEMINEILDLAIVESGKLSLSLEPISLIDVMYECQTMIEPQAQKRGIGVAFRQIESAYFVQADRTRVKQVLINLLSNAIKYNQVGGTVVVDCVASSAQRIRICVRDTGKGLAPDKLTQLFQPFNRIGQEAGREEGTGMGLVMSKRLVELMGGEIGVESTVGKGSVFWIDLNLTAQPQPADARFTTVAPPQVHANAPLRTVLYVEDNPANLMLIEDLLARRADIRVLSAANGKQGVQIALASQPDVILMDINLPGISGIQALEILREIPATAHIPVIALTANAMPRDIQKGLAAGFFRYLTKPIKVNEFMDTLDVALKFSKTQSARENNKEENA